MFEVKYYCIVKLTSIFKKNYIIDLRVYFTFKFESPARV